LFSSQSWFSNVIWKFNQWKLVLKYGWYGVQCFKTNRTLFYSCSVHTQSCVNWKRNCIIWLDVMHGFFVFMIFVFWKFNFCHENSLYPSIHLTNMFFLYPVKRCWLYFWTYDKSLVSNAITFDCFEISTQNLAPADMIANILMILQPVILCNSHHAKHE